MFQLSLSTPVRRRFNIRFRVGDGARLIYCFVRLCNSPVPAISSGKIKLFINEHRQDEAKDRRSPRV
jgi:hypothetical protein